MSTQYLPNNGAAVGWIIYTTDTHWYFADCSFKLFMPGLINAKIFRSELSARNRLNELQGSVHEKLDLMKLEE